MRFLRLDRCALTICVVAAVLAGCSGSQPPLGAPAAVPPASHLRLASGSGCGSNCCPALPGGTGILPDGDFSQSNNWGGWWFTWKKHYTPAPDWTVSKGTIDMIGSTYWDIDGLCSVDLDGYSPGGIESVPFRTKPGASYTLSFLFSGNGETGPTTKTMVISIDRQSTIYTWDISGGNDAQDGDYSTEAWGFKATKRFSLIRFTSKDPPGSASGPVVAAVTITKD
ncbi:MAG TPA: DUF642 domain-containing protein [Candidatus Cybelea sp.]|nr:DUF642 domain-containing protein [Candidatus Cybelea sp.]